MRRLAYAEFGCTTPDVEVVLEAFAAPFPSLRGISSLAMEILSTFDTFRINEKVLSLLDENAGPEDWGGEVFAMGKLCGSSWKITEIQVVPYVGDRRLIIRDFRKAPVWPSFLVITDYQERPSAVAAREVIGLGTVLAWNPPQYVDE